MRVMLQCPWPVLYMYIAYWSCNMIQTKYAHIKSSETLASFKNPVRKVDIENLLRTVTCATLRIMWWAGFLSLSTCVFFWVVK